MSLYLCHHGIKGMKWGVRRYQNSDGTYTDEGRKRYGLGAKLYTPSNKEHSQKSANVNHIGAGVKHPDISKGTMLYRVSSKENDLGKKEL